MRSNHGDGTGDISVDSLHLYKKLPSRNGIVDIVVFSVTNILKW